MKRIGLTRSVLVQLNLVEIVYIVAVENHVGLIFLDYF